MRKLLPVFLILLFSTVLFAVGPVAKYVVFLKDKNNNPYSLSNPSVFLSQRALDRRARYWIGLDMKDLPVTPSYVSQVRATGAGVVYSLKWFNAVVVETDNQSALAAIAALPFVDHIDQVLTKNTASSSKGQGVKQVEEIPLCTFSKPIPFYTSGDSSVFNYGQATNQTHMIAVDLLHNKGYTGLGIWIAILDAGFCHADQVSAFDSLWDNNRILGTRDFNLPGNNVFADTMHTHGTAVLSTMGANLPGQIVGTAPHASFWLIRTEVGWYEAPVEEYNWAAGAEFADSVGADIINSSLGYTTFNDSVFNHTYSDMNGNTTPVTRAADLASSRGMIVVNSAGNDGGSAWHYISAPADGDSVLAIGAVNSQGVYASFSSTGPSADGRIKPDVSAQGAGTTVVAANGSVVQGSGTSFSSPIMAGAMACLWQAMPETSAEDLRNAVRKTASQFNAPDSLMGFGIPNMMNALTLLSVNSIQPDGKKPYTLYPVPFSDSPWLRSNLNQSETVKIDVLSIAGQLVYSQNINIAGSSAIKLNSFNTLPPGLYLVRIATGSRLQMIRAVKYE